MAGVKATNLQSDLNLIKKQSGKILGNNSNLITELNSKIDGLIKNNSISITRANIEDIARTISKDPEFQDSKRAEIAAKGIGISVEKLMEKHSQEVWAVKREEFGKKVVEETKKLNPGIKEEQLSEVKRYGRMVAKSCLSENVLDKYKDEAFQANKELGPGKLENSWSDLKGMMAFLGQRTKDIEAVRKEHEEIKNNLGDIKLPENLGEVRSFENMMVAFNNPNATELFSKAQGFLGRVEKIDKLAGGWLSEKVYGVGIKMASRIGNQAVSEFATNALGIMAKEGFKEGFSTVMRGIVSGGVKAAAAAGGAAAASGAAAGIASGIGAIAGVAGGPIVWLATAGMAVLKGIKKIGQKIVDKINNLVIGGEGENTENIGKRKLLWIILIPALLLVGCTLQNNDVSTLVPPANSAEYYLSQVRLGNFLGDVGSKVAGIRYSGDTILSRTIVMMDVSKSNIGCDVYYGKKILKRLAVNAVIREQTVQILQEICAYIKSNPYVKEKVIITAGMLNGSTNSYPHEYALGIDLFHSWKYTYNGKIYSPYRSWGQYSDFICEVCGGDETCPQNINIQIYERIFRAKGWCWGGYWGNWFDPMHFEVLRPWKDKCSVKNRTSVKCG